MTFEIRKAERKKAKLKLGVSGPSGSGKTYSSLLDKVTLIDTENGSGELYAHLGPYNVIPFNAPFSPARYVEAIKAAVNAGTEVIVIDSISHEWDGQGGCLDIQSKLGGKYQDWAKVTPMHNAFVEAILQSPAHVIVTTRKKQDYEMSKSDGKTKVEKVGLKEIQRDGFEYELTINFDVEINHYATASKDRTGLFMPRPTFKINEDTGKELLEWANSGAEPETFDPAEEVIGWSKKFRDKKVGDVWDNKDFQDMCNWAINDFGHDDRVMKGMHEDSKRWMAFIESREKEIETAKSALQVDADLK
jgi:hypothetical protein